MHLLDDAFWKRVEHMSTAKRNAEDALRASTRDEGSRVRRLRVVPDA